MPNVGRQSRRLLLLLLLLLLQCSASPLPPHPTPIPPPSALFSPRDMSLVAVTSCAFGPGRYSRPPTPKTADQTRCNLCRFRRNVIAVLYERRTKSGSESGSKTGSSAARVYRSFETAQRMPRNVCRSGRTAGRALLERCRNSGSESGSRSRRGEVVGGNPSTRVSPPPETAE